MNRRCFLGGVLGSIALHVRGAKAHAGNTARHGILSLRSWDWDVLVRTLWGECRGEPTLGQIGVAQVAFNRAIADDHSVATICRTHDQFSCWRRPWRLLHVSHLDEEYRLLRAVAERAFDLYQRGMDVTGGANHYLIHGIDHPDWARGRRPIRRIGHHDFYYV